MAAKAVRASPPARRADFAHGKAGSEGPQGCQKRRGSFAVAVQVSPQRGVNAAREESSDSRRYSCGWML